nr:MAG TPA: hypothetical protein [Caudoviricetes sp.]
MEKSHGTLTATSATLHGTLSARTVIGADIYDGAYTVHSEAHEVQILPTANKQLTKNITVEKIPYFETSNLSDGITAYIGSEVEVNYG